MRRRVLAIAIPTAPPAPCTEHLPGGRTGSRIALRFTFRRTNAPHPTARVRAIYQAGPPPPHQAGEQQYDRTLDEPIVHGLAGPGHPDNRLHPSHGAGCRTGIPRRKKDRSAHGATTAKLAAPLRTGAARNSPHVFAAAVRGHVSSNAFVTVPR